MFQCVRASHPPFLRSDTESAVLGETLEQCKRLCETCFIGGTRERMLERKIQTTLWLCWHHGVLGTYCN